MEIAPAAVAQSLAELVRIPSVNPLHAGPRAEAAGPIGEQAVADHLAARFDALGAAEVVVDDVADGRPNVYGFFSGRTERLVVLDVHIDTVTVEHMTDPPFDGRIEDGRVWGRGALDTKASLGVITALLDAWQQSDRRPEPTLLVVASAGEEAGGLLGAGRFRTWAERRDLRIDQMIISEPTGFAPLHGHKGGMIMDVEIEGLAAHSAVPELGRNAIDAAAPVLAALQAEHERLATVPPTTELGVSTLTVTSIQGGTGGNVVPAACTIGLNQRLVPGDDPQEVFDRVAALVADACPLPVRCTSPFGTGDEVGLPAFYQSPDTPIVGDLARWAGTTPGVAPFGTNAMRYVGFCDQVAVFGPGRIEDAHQATESVAIADLMELAAIFTTWLAPA